MAKGRQRVSIRPVQLREHDDRLGCDVLRVVGYRARCGCGWSSPSRQSVSIARADVKAHRVAGCR